MNTMTKIIYFVAYFNQVVMQIAWNIRHSFAKRIQHHLRLKAIGAFSFSLSKPLYGREA